MERWIKKTVAKKTFNFLFRHGSREFLLKNEAQRAVWLRRRAERLEAESHAVWRPGCLLGTVIGFGKTYLESAHLPVAPWIPYGVGDVVVLAEAGLGIDVPSFRRLDKFDRKVSAILAAVPWLPSVPTRALYRAYRQTVEDNAFTIQNEIDQNRLER